MQILVVFFIVLLGWQFDDILLGVEVCAHVLIDGTDRTKILIDIIEDGNSHRLIIPLVLIGSS